MDSDTEVRKGPKRSDSDQIRPSVRSEKSESPIRTRTSDRTDSDRPESVSKLLVETFGGEVGWYQTPSGREVGKRPNWLDWPTVRASEMGRPIKSQKDLVRMSKFGRRRPA
jgi:hypothetical protein